MSHHHEVDHTSTSAVDGRKRVRQHWTRQIVTAVAVLATGAGLVAVRAAPALADTPPTSCNAQIGWDQQNPTLGPINWATIAPRAADWLNKNVEYNQACGYVDGNGGYRTDCSGYVSMAWGLDHSYTTGNFNPTPHAGYGENWDSSLTKAIPWSAIQPGDALVTDTADEGHIALVSAYDPATQTGTVEEESTYGVGTISAPFSEHSGEFASFTPVRYTKFIPTSQPPAQGPSYEVALQTNGHDLWTLGSSGYRDWGAGMDAASSPAITQVGSGYETALQTNGHQLWTLGSVEDKNWALGMLPGTSPSIAALSGGGYEVAFQANTGSLWTVGTAGSKNWGLGVQAGTSPAITAVSGGYEVAVQTNTGTLWTVGNAGYKNWGLGMNRHTSPSITAVGAGYETAFESNTNTLWTAGTVETKNWATGMATATSPAITAVTGGYEVAVQTNTGTLWTVGNAGYKNWGLGMKAGTSPAITAVTGGYETAFQANTGTLWTAGTAETKNWGAGMTTATNPAITG